MFFDTLLFLALYVYFHVESTRIREDFRLLRKKITLIKTSLLPLALKMFKQGGNSHSNFKLIVLYRVT